MRLPFALTLAAVLVIGAACLMIPVAVVGGTPNATVHPTTDRLRLRSSVPVSLSEHNVIRTVRRGEAFRIIGRRTGVSEQVGQQREWLQVENLASGERGWIAAWWAESMSLPPQATIQTRPLGRVAVRSITNVIPGLLAVLLGALMALGDLRDGLVAVRDGLILLAAWAGIHELRKRRSRPNVSLPDANPAPTPESAPDVRTRYTHSGARYYGFSPSGRVWSAPRS